MCFCCHSQLFSINAMYYLFLYRRQMPYYTHPDYRIYEFNKKLLQRTEVCLHQLLHLFFSVCSNAIVPCSKLIFLFRNISWLSNVYSLKKIENKLNRVATKLGISGKIRECYFQSRKIKEKSETFLEIKENQESFTFWIVAFQSNDFLHIQSHTSTWVWKSPNFTLVYIILFYAVLIRHSSVSNETRTFEWTKLGSMLSQTPYLSKEMIKFQLRVTRISVEISRISLKTLGKIREFFLAILVATLSNAMLKWREKEQT